MMRVVFLGNHAVGVRALDALRACADVAMVVAHPADAEDGVRYLSVHDHARRAGLAAVRMNGRDAGLVDVIAKAAPDLLVTVDYRYLLPRAVIAVARHGAINLHPGLLPKYRGRAPLNWAILNGETELGLTAHFLDEGVDSGDIIAQERFTLDADEDVGDALERLYPMYERMIRRVVGYFQEDDVPREPQDHALATTYPCRKPEDGEIDWCASAEEVHRLVRAVADPYPGACSTLAGRRVIVWRACVDNAAPAGAAGEIVGGDVAAGYVVACGVGVLRVTRWSVDGVAQAQWPAGVGAVFGETETVVLDG